jgi:hypothetical protein
MLKLFRNIRRNLLNEGKTTKYFKYAIGEIILVVIGILIALQINEWNENRKTQNKSFNYLQRLQGDLNTSITRADYFMNDTRRKQEYAAIVLDALESQELLASQKEIFEKYLKEYYQFQILIPEINTINEMTSSGDLGLIKNQWLRSSFASIASTREFIMEVNQSNHDAYKINIGSFQKYIRYHVQKIDTDSTVTTVNYDFDSMAKDTVFINQISGQSYNWYEIASMYDNYKSGLSSVRDTLQKELKTYDK